MDLGCIRKQTCTVVGLQHLLSRMLPEWTKIGTSTICQPVAKSHSSIQKQLNQQNQQSCWFCSRWWRKEDLAPWPMCCLHFIWMLNSRHMFALGPSRSHFFPLSSERFADCFTLRRFPTEALANPEWNLPTRHQCWWLTTRPEQWTSRIRPFLIYCLVILMKFARPVALSLHKGIHCRLDATVSSCCDSDSWIQDGTSLAF